MRESLAKIRPTPRAQVVASALPCRRRGRPFACAGSCSGVARGGRGGGADIAAARRRRRRKRRRRRGRASPSPADPRASGGGARARRERRARARRRRSVHGDRVPAAMALRATREAPTRTRGSTLAGAVEDPNHEARERARAREGRRESARARERGGGERTSDGVGRARGICAGKTSCPRSRRRRLSAPPPPHTRRRRRPADTSRRARRARAHTRQTALAAAACCSGRRRGRRPIATRRMVSPRARGRTVPVTRPRRGAARARRRLEPRGGRRRARAVPGDEAASARARRRRPRTRRCARPAQHRHRRERFAPGTRRRTPLGTLRALSGTFDGSDASYVAHVAADDDAAADVATGRPARVTAALRRRRRAAAAPAGGTGLKRARARATRRRARSWARSPRSIGFEGMAVLGPRGDRGEREARSRLRVGKTFHLSL